MVDVLLLVLNNNLIIQWGWISNEGFGGNHLATTYYPRAFSTRVIFSIRSPYSSSTQDCGTSHCLYSNNVTNTYFTHYDTFFNMVQGWKWIAFGF